MTMRTTHSGRNLSLRQELEEVIVEVLEETARPKTWTLPGKPLIAGIIPGSGGEACSVRDFLYRTAEGEEVLQLLVENVMDVLENHIDPVVESAIESLQDAMKRITK